MNEVLVVIPARGGSKRLPKKNTMQLGNKPLIAHSIEYALRNGYKQSVYVTTDSEEIAETAEKYGAKIIMRPEGLSGDLISTGEVLQHLSGLLVENGINFKYFALLQPTNPLRPKNLLKDAVDYVISNKSDSLFTVSPMLRKTGKIINNRFEPFNYKFGQRSQDMDKYYYENGLLYITCKKMIDQGLVSNQYSYPMIIDHIFGSVDIDTAEDFKMAEYYYNEYLG